MSFPQLDLEIKNTENTKLETRLNSCQVDKTQREEKETTVSSVCGSLC
jgi:hypothetical protein